jgi:hypothetical protein
MVFVPHYVEVGVWMEWWCLLMDTQKMNESSSNTRYNPLYNQPTASTRFLPATVGRDGWLVMMVVLQTTTRIHLLGQSERRMLAWKTEKCICSRKCISDASVAVCLENNASFLTVSPVVRTSPNPTHIQVAPNEPVFQE